MQTMTLFLVTSALILLGCSATTSYDGQEDLSERPEYAMVIHGGAGVILKENMSDEREQAYRDALDEALRIGEDLLKAGASSLDAVVATIKFMEDSPLFNAGKGAVFTHEGSNELDASIMDGRDLNAGAIGGVKTVKNPITAARAVMENSEHVMLVGRGAETFASEQNIEVVDPSYFHTERRWKSLQKVLKANGEQVSEDTKHGTVGACALDKHGNLAAGTSTGGMTNKKYNRIGDAPVIGAGTYANNKTCAVSATGHGEYFIRYAVAHAISAQMEFANKSLVEAGDEIIHRQLVEAGGTGGVVSLDKDGNIHMPFNTPGMYRGYVRDGERHVMIYQDH